MYAGNINDIKPLADGNLKGKCTQRYLSVQDIGAVSNIARIAPNTGEHYGSTQLKSAVLLCRLLRIQKYSLDNLEIILRFI